MKDEPLRRTLLVLLAYVVVAYPVVLLGGWLRRVLALPPLFETLLHGGLVLGVPVAAVLAWRYPELAAVDDDTEPAGTPGEDES
ncbi:MAG: hypothetical protein R3304_04385 [Longimicrobiales bacterium]|nr:hypothetical protein [Longimicrobiales bacterium]